jgi:hypothetical protein
LCNYKQTALKLRIGFELDERLFVDVNGKDEVRYGPLLYRNGDVRAMSKGDGKRTIEWRDSWPTCFLTATVKCLSVCRVAVSLWAHDSLGNVVQQSLVI